MGSWLVLANASPPAAGEVSAAQRGPESGDGIHAALVHGDGPPTEPEACNGDEETDAAVPGGCVDWEHVARGLMLLP